MKKKILIVINSNNFFRNYIETKAFAALEKNFDCSYLVADKKIQSKLKKKNLFFININNFIKKIYNFKIKINYFINPYNSETINYLINRQLNRKIMYRGESYFFSYMIYLRIFNRIINNLNFFFKFFFSFIFKRLDIIVAFYFKKLIFKKIKPDLIVFPYQSDEIYFGSILSTVKTKIPFMGLVDNWDNLSSKSNLDVLPDFISVWGNQTKNHAIKYQGFKSRQIFVLGTPRYDNFFKSRNKKIKSNFKFKYILFLESFFCYNNVEELKILDELLNNNLLYKNYKIIYRPHPWQKKHSIDVEKLNLKSVIIDPQVKKNYLNKNFHTDFQPSLKYYPSLIKNAEIVITGPTSMLIESTIFHKKILLLGHKNFSDITYFDQLKHFVHLKDVEKLSNLIVCKNLKDLELNLTKLKKMKKKRLNNKIDKERNFYLCKDKKTYSNKLNEIVNKII
jgi:hypothetical protein